MMRSFVLGLLVALAAAGNSQPTFAANFDGTWQAGGEPLPGTEQWCADWFVRLDVVNGRASGVVSLEVGTEPLQNIVLRPNGRFTATAAGGGLTSDNGREMLTHRVSGKLSGDTITASLTVPDSPACGTRTAKGTRLKG
jgi:hypothetical protein